MLRLLKNRIFSSAFRRSSNITKNVRTIFETLDEYSAAGSTVSR